MGHTQKKEMLGNEANGAHLCSCQGKCFLRVHFFELKIKVPTKTDLVLVEGMFSQCLLRGLVSSAYSWQREARILHSNLPFSWNRESIKSKRQIWEVPWILLQNSPPVLSSPPPAKLKAKLFLEPRWLDGTLGQFGPGRSRTSPCVTCRHSESLPWKPSGKWCLDPSGGPPDLQLLLGDLHEGTQCWTSPNLRHGKLLWWLRKFAYISEAGVAGWCQGGCHLNLCADWGKCLSSKAVLIGMGDP